ncbi:MAG: DNA repair exonuclease [Planctomycetota bacterium]
MAEATLLAVGDLHLGKPIASLPEALRDRSRRLGPFGALESIVRLAREERVDAVLLAGDVVDDDTAYFEVLGPLSAAADTLAGIPMIAVAGNHDAHVLPRLADAIPGLHLLGRNGAWERREVGRGVEILGWSFPDTHVNHSPMAGVPPRGNVLRIGLLHADVGGHASRYAPVPPAELDAAPADAWLLGHIHQPDLDGLARARPVGYLGGACGLDPSEHGPLGAWTLRCGARVAAEHAPIAPLAWLHRSLDCTELDPDDLSRAIHQDAADAVAVVPNAEAVGLRITLVGRSAWWRAFADAAGAQSLGEPWRAGSAEVFLDRVRCRVRPAVDVEALAGEPSVAGGLASLLGDIRSGAAADLERSAADALAALHQRIAPDAPRPEARAALEAAAEDLLAELVGQHDGPHGHAD